MQFTGDVHLSSETLRRLAAAAREHRVGVYKHACMAVAAAAAVYRRDAVSSLVPAVAVDRGPWPATVLVHMAPDTAEAMALAARRHGLDLEEQLRLVLDAAVENYTAAAPPPGPPPVPRHPPFDARRYAALPLPVRRRPNGNLTAALMGDPSHGGPSLTAMAAGRSAGIEADAGAAATGRRVGRGR